MRTWVWRLIWTDGDVAGQRLCPDAGADQRRCEQDSAEWFLWRNPLTNWGQRG
jgi:hypothetical protein